MAPSSAASSSSRVVGPRRLVGEELRAVERDAHVGQGVLQALEGPDGDTELLALGHVPHRDLERAQPQARRARPR